MAACGSPSPRCTASATISSCSMPRCGLACLSAERVAPARRSPHRHRLRPGAACSSRRAAPAPTSTTASSTPTAPRSNSAATARAASRVRGEPRHARLDRAAADGQPGRLVKARLRPDGLVSVAMGVPDFDPASLPFDAPARATIYHLDTSAGPGRDSAPSRSAIRTRSSACATSATRPWTPSDPPWRITRGFRGA